MNEAHEERKSDTCIEEGDTEGTKTTELSVTLFEIANGLNKLLNGRGLAILNKVALGSQSRIVHDDIGLGEDDQRSKIQKRILKGVHQQSNRPRQWQRDCRSGTFSQKSPSTQGASK